MILSTLFGLASGIVGSMIARAFLLEKTFNIPLVGDIDFLDDNNGRPSIIIRSADKVVMELPKFSSFLIFLMLETSIWRTRSRVMPYFCPMASKVIRLGFLPNPKRCSKISLVLLGNTVNSFLVASSG